MGGAFVIDGFEDGGDFVMDLGHAVKPVFCSRVVSFVSRVAYLYSSWVPAVSCSKRGVSMGCVCGRVVCELSEW